jgi:hypothetical protein
VVEDIANRISYVEALLADVPGRFKEPIRKALFPATRQYTDPRQAPAEARLLSQVFG